MDRMTPEIDPHKPELLAFAPDEAVLGIKAISYFVSSSLQSSEANWDTEGFNAFNATPDGATKSINTIAAFVAFHKGITDKLATSMNSGSPVEFTPDEIGAFGDALFRLGNSGIKHAKQAMPTLAFFTDEDRQRAEAYIEDASDQAYKLFKKLEPIAKSKANIGWMVWEKAQA